MSQPIHEPFVPKDADEHMAAGLLERAKKIHSRPNDGAEPMMIMTGDRVPGGIAIMSLGRVARDVGADWNSQRDRTKLFRCCRELVQKVKPACVAFISDVWVTMIDEEKASARGLDSMKWREWPKDAQAEIVLRREAMMITVETKARQFILQQFYARDPLKRPLWEETVKMDGPIEGNLAGMLKDD